MRCRAIVPPGTYRYEAEQCSKTRNVVKVSWEKPNEKNRTAPLCTAHRGVLERKGDIEIWK